ncbi:C-type mannose receptor 2-like [Acanthopagrus latus]|uniref:C-type mannose receptor 2-like n=1 Tax=Acanthopagrus latus TaxID=8177 RepID=UPI00187D0933|nr:C-type mannose receptor 2-like [Acanthopagrus latus]XP_036968046.1 C-type mannose receptor 2-like [Acanthopagrus latus]
MQWSRFLLLLMGQCSLFTCQLYKYHFINKNKSWYEAQEYCRQKYTDLASVYRQADINTLQTAKKQGKEAWIGLYKETVTNKTEWEWRWSQAEVKYTENQTKWENGEPNNAAGSEYCVSLKAPARHWWDYSCTVPRPFICYDANTTSDQFYVIETQMTWLQARKYCRENYKDLVSGKTQLEDQELTGKLQDKTRDYWIGLFRVTWRWSDGRSSFVRPWNQIYSDSQPDNKCAKLDKEGRWRTDNCNSTKPFFCYNDKVILVKENKTWEEAINHCREKYNDLISITDAEQQSWVQEIAKNASSSHVWLGLRFTCILEAWFWVTNERVDYKNWASSVKMDNCDMSGAMETGGEHKWCKEDDMREFNFLCSKF